ncbi:MAG: T9SS type A sorting domain-containing protein, partial [Salinivirgaceae bacterium]|nr:T9SS type A sorting domain-containing protein [Salinivirgaceae bacterium]
ANGDIAGIITITNDNNCSADFEFNKPISDGYVWRGSASTEWSNAGNWYSNAVPNNEHGAVIRTATNLPVISTTANAKSVKIESGELTISGDHTLNVYGDWQNEVGNDGFVGTSSTVAFKNDAEISGNTTFNNISTETGKTVNIGSGQVTATGNVANAGTLTGSNSTTLVMSGSGEATMTGGTYNLASLTIDKSDGITSNADLNVGGTFAINAGVLTMVDDHKVNLGTNATATSGGETAYVDGTMTKTGSSAVTFPIGNNGRRAMVGIEPSEANESTLFTASYIYTPKEEVETPDEAPAKVDGLKRVSSMDRWNITGNASSYLTLYWDNGTISEIGDPATLVVAHWSASNNQWEMFETNALDGTTAASGGIKTRGLVSSYSPFAFGATDDGINALPVELVGYTGRQNGNTVELEWTTLSEKDNDFFEIERSTDGLNFVTIGFVQGAGNSVEKLAYSFADNAPESGLAYYRLSQVDYDGTRSYADRLVSVAYTADGFISLTVAPNPTRGQFSVRITGPTNGVAKLLTQSGKPIRIIDIRNLTESIDISDLPSGIYILQYQSGENVVHERVVKL